MSDGEARRVFTTGSVRDCLDGKPRIEMIPAAALERIGQRFAEGARIYEPWNAHRGQPVTVMLGSLLRHAVAYSDCDDGEDHIAAVGWNACMLMHVEREIQRGNLPAHLDDRLPLRMEEWKRGIPGADDQGRLGEDDT